MSRVLLASLAACCLLAALPAVGAHEQALGSLQAPLGRRLLKKKAAAPAVETIGAPASDSCCARLAAVNFSSNLPVVVVILDNVGAWGSGLGDLQHPVARSHARLTEHLPFERAAPTAFFLPLLQGTVSSIPHPDTTRAPAQVGRVARGMRLQATVASTHRPAAVAHPLHPSG